LAILKALQNPTHSFTLDPTKFFAFPIATAGTVSDFSSPGLDPELHIKPDIGGIGGHVLSTVSAHAREENKLASSYNIMSGTSMSSPYVSGTLALLLEAKRQKAISFDEIKARLLNNAKPALNLKTNLSDSVATQGAGLVHIYDAIMAKSLVTPPLICKFIFLHGILYVFYLRFVLYL
jgi:minor extracellular serine protease Vpr